MSISFFGVSPGLARALPAYIALRDLGSAFRNLENETLYNMTAARANIFASLTNIYI